MILKWHLYPQIANHGNIVISELLSKNLTGFDVQSAFDGMFLQAGFSATAARVGS